MPAPDNTSTTVETTGSLAGELFAPGVGAQAGPPTTPAGGTATAGEAGPGAHSHGGPAPTGSPAERFTSTDPDAFGEPTGREEDWRFTPMRRIRPLLQGAPSDAHLQWDTDLPEGVELTSVAADDPLLKGLPEPVDRLAALTRQRSGGAAVVRVPAEAQLDRPVVLRLTGTGSDDVVWGQLVVEVGAFAEATVVLDHSGLARYSGGVAVLVGDGAQVTVVSVQDWAPGAVHGGQFDAVVGRDATVKQVVVTLGGDLVRLLSNVQYAGPGGTAELFGVYFADETQHQEHRLWVDHAVPNCTSNVLYKGALQGEKAHTVWVGDVRIRPAATGTDTYELNRNLVLTDGARADSVPNLEIETGEIVGAGHASATGRFDDEQLFYLCSRGIDAETARRLVVRGFFADVVQHIGLPELQDRLMGTIEARLGALPGLDEQSVEA
ncbi:Fe-S cluster assembly protein SufD [Geodermatophilus sabuli]|uniref:Iron-regulated ABC transporter permease protein SufD n=1 Tax=Geodermatophilus sabuli TaxID=1564158 RepID=A0A285ECZ2_9ACTN|nr:Fe-S cluster assembly protein SufD [Geodermatophilus sabuli]MBB3085634.1 Fe-S cluster assembly protein SufD [Geodermatophilus sabuli]SNX95946.1 Iron-regulated ABC transporter permease protein SufD [Geodermatophilus sabuli]